MGEQSAVLGLGSKIEAGTKQAFSTIADGFRQIAKAMSDSAASMRKVGQDAPAKIFEEAAKGVNKLTSSLDKQVASTKMLSKAQVEGKAVVDAHAEAQAKSASKIAKANAELEKSSLISAKASAQLDILKAKFHDVLNAPGATGKSANNLMSSFLTPGLGAGGEITLPKINDGGQTKVLEAQLQRLQRSFRETAAVATKSASSFQALNAKFPGFEKQIRALDKTNLSYQEQIAVLGRLKQANKDVEASASNYNKQSEGIQKLRKQYADLRISTDRYGVAANKIIGNIQRHNIEIAKASAALARLKQQQAAAESGFTTIGGAINLVIGKLRSYAGYMVASSAVFAFIAGIRSAVTAIADYDQSLKDLQAITNPTQKELSEMGATLKKVAGDTKFSASEVADGMKLLGQAGLEADEVIAAIPGVTNLATGTMSDLASVIDLTSTTMRAFGLAAKDTGYITDVFANAVNKSKLTIDDIKTAFNYIAPAAHNAGMSLDETARVMMVLRDNGLKASSMATGFRRILAKLAIPTESLKKGIKDAGLELKDFDVNALGISKVLHNLAKVVKTNQDAFEDFGVYGSAAVTALIKDVDKFDALEGVVERSGASAKMAAIQMQGLQNMFKNLQTKVQGLFIALGEGGLTGVLKAMVNVARTAVDVITDLADNGFVQFIAKGVLAVGAVKLLTAALTWFKGTAFITSALGAISIGLAAVQSAMGATNVSAIAMTMAVDKATAALVLLSRTAALAIFAAIVYEIAAYSQKLKDLGVELDARAEEIEKNIVALKVLEAALSNGTLKDSSATVDELAKKYKSWGVELRAAAGDADKLAEVLAKIRAEQQKEGTALTYEKLENIGKQYTDNAERATTYSISLRRLLHDEGKQTQITDDITKKNKELADEYVKTGKALGMSNSEILSSLKKELSSGFIFKWDREKLLTQAEEVLKSLENPAKESGKKIGEQTALGIKEALEEGMKDEDLKFKADTFEKSEEVSKYKSDTQKLEKEMAQRLYSISVAEAQGVITHEYAELQKLDYTIKAYDDMVEAAKKYHAEAVKSGTATQERDAQTTVDAAIDKAYEVRLQKLQAYGAQRVAIEERIKEWKAKADAEEATHDNKVLENKKTASDKISALEVASGLKAKGVAQAVLDFKKKQANEIVELEEEVKTKVVEIEDEAKDKRIAANKEFKDKLAELAKERIEIERSAAADIAGLQDSLQDKITNLRMKGLEGANKERALEAAANARLLQGKKALAEASARNDKEAIERAKQLMESAGGYYDQLEDPKKAINGLTAVTQALIAARKAQEKAELAENRAKLDKEKALHLDKINSINKAEDDALKKAQARFKLKVDAVNLHYENAVAKEQARHEKEMANIAAEIAKLREEAALVAGQQAAVVNSAALPSGSSGSSAPNITSPDFDMEKYERDIGIATSKGIQTGITAGTQMSAEQVKQAVSEQVAAGARDGMFKDVKIDGVPFEEWKKLGKKGGDAVVTAVEEEIKNFDITENLEGAPVSVPINPATKEEVDPLLNSIKEALEKYPGEPTLDFTEAEKMIQKFVKDAKSKYRIEIPVTTTQNKASGGQVYPMARGGKVPGTKSPKDKVLVNSRPGEWYIPDEPASYWAKSVGSWFMNAVHKPMSQAGQYLKDSVLKGPKSRAVPIPVPGQSGINTNVLSSLKDLSTLDTRIGEQLSKVADVISSVATAGGGVTYNVPLHYSGPANQSSARELARTVLSELEKLHRGRS